MEDKYKSYYKSPIGWLEIIADDKNILAINFVKRRKVDKSNALSKKCVVQLRQYFAGQRKKFDLAAMGGKSTAARSVGMAAHKNKIPIIIPCHRVLGSRGQLVGYAGGLWRKKYLLNLEQH